LRQLPFNPNPRAAVKAALLHSLMFYRGTWEWSRDPYRFFLRGRNLYIPCAYPYSAQVLFNNELDYPGLSLILPVLDPNR